MIAASNQGVFREFKRTEGKTRRKAGRPGHFKTAGGGLSPLALHLSLVVMAFLLALSWTTCTGA